jgi:pimeloyl-ACP methyl ester carboxylesterase
MTNLLYLHGFASSPASTKARAFSARAREKWGIDVPCLDLRVPSFPHLRISEMIRSVREHIGGPVARVVLIGSSLGGLTAARVAEADARVCGLVLLAPAFLLADRWKSRLGEANFHTWEESGWLTVDDYATGAKARVDFGFIEELSRVDRGFPDVRVPTFIVHGGHDDVVLPEVSRDFATGKPWVRRIEVNDGHELNATMPTWLPQVEEFLMPWLGPGAVS